MDRSHYCKVDDEKASLKCLVFGSHNGHESLDLQHYSQQVVYNSFNRDFPQYSTFNQNHGWCHEHNMDRSYYCKVDDEKVCLRCLGFGSHNGHELLDLDQNHGWCHEHNMKRSHYCKVDDEKVCLKCLVFGSHNGHESLDLDLEQVQKQRGYNFGSYDPPSNQFNFGWCNEPSPNPMFFGTQERQQFE